MTISAESWVESATIAPEVFERWPSYRAVLVAADRLDLTRMSVAADALIDQAHSVAGGVLEGDVDRHVELWHQAYRDFGVKPRTARVSVDALLRRAATDDGMPRINTLVDLYNAISMIEVVPIGGEDLDDYAGPARLILAGGDEPFLTRAGGELVTEHPKPGEPIWVDDEGVTCRRWNWRQTTRTAISDGTQRVGFIIDSLAAPDHCGAHAAADRLLEFVDGACVRVISKE